MKVDKEIALIETSHLVDGQVAAELQRDLLFNDIEAIHRLVSNTEDGRWRGVANAGKDTEFGIGVDIVEGGIVAYCVNSDTYGTYFLRLADRSVHIPVDDGWAGVPLKLDSLPTLTDAHRLVTLIAMQSGSWKS